MTLIDLLPLEQRRQLRRPDGVPRAVPLLEDVGDPCLRC